MTPEQRQRWQRAADIFDAVVELPDAARRAQLDARCADDASLRAQVENMLTADASQTEPFSGEAGRWSDELADQPGESATDWRGRRFGAWQIVNTVGRGGMGVVHEVQRDDDAYQQRAALKLIRLDADSPAVRERFLRERQVLAHLQHPGIATLLDGGFSEDGWPYFVMEYVDGQPIDTWCDARELGLRERVSLFGRVLDAVQYAHRNLVVHRDLKPTNILVTDDGQIKLLDFGIAKQLHGPDAATVGERALTVEYASPEQLNAAPITTATDIWQLGIVLYRLLVGVHPFGIDADTPLARQLQKLDREPEPLTRAAGRASAHTARARGIVPRALGKVLRGDLSRVVRGCLQRNPEHRYSSVEALAEDLHRWSQHRPLRIVAPSRWKVAALWLRRNRAVAAVISSATLAVLIGAGVALWQADVARQHSANAGETLQFLRDTLTAAAPEQAMASHISVRELLDKAREELAKRATVADDVRQPVERMLGDLYQSLGEPQIAVGLYESGLHNVHPRDRDQALRLAATWNDYATALGALERGDASLAAAEHAATLRRRFARTDPQQELLALVGLGYGHYYADHAEQARDLWLQAIAMGDQMRDPPVLSVVEAYYMAAGVEAAVGQQAKAVKLADDAQAYADAHGLPSRSPLRISILRAKAMAELRSGNPGGAETAIREAISIADEVLGGTGDLSSKVYSQLGVILRHQGRLREAIPTQERALSLADHAMPASVGIDLYKLASTYRCLGDYPRALALFASSLAKLDEAGMSVDDITRRRIERDRANCLIAMARHAEADDLLRRLLDSAIRLDGDSSMEYLFVVWQKMLLAQRRADSAAMRSFVQVLEGRVQERFSPDHPVTANFLRAKASLARLDGDLAAAEGLQRDAVEIWRRNASSSVDLARAQSELAHIHFERDDTVQSRTVLAEALAVLREGVLPQEVKRAEAEALALKLGL